ncbi:MAG: 30S ribosomal protein S18 [Candidatus Cloacimonadota bacterium]|nr:MAG: 30S ribosomal protein S18 [Candidatus Cloacimonadota bacterium]
MPRRYDNGKKKKKEKKRRRKLILQKKLGIEPKKKFCHFTKEGIEYIDYKDVNLLKRFVNDKGTILPGRTTGTKLRHQKRLTLAIKRARYMALLPFSPEKYI